MFLDLNFLKRCLFLDIETVSEVKSYSDLDDVKRELWDIKTAQLLRAGQLDPEMASPELAFEMKAGIFAEFAKIACISLGFVSFEDDVPMRIRLKSLAGEDERYILEDFSRLLTNHYNDPETVKISGHNIKEFDIPFICRRMVINQVRFPHILDLSGKKPWQTGYLLDTMDMWRFGDYKNYTSLKLLAGTLGIASPKDDIDGSMVGHTYWIEEDIDKIVNYCQKDVTTVIQVMLRFAGCDLIDESHIELINHKT
jgi:3'-5' exonuclease